MEGREATPVVKEHRTPRVRRLIREDMAQSQPRKKAPKRIPDTIANIW
jgi:hypothetical protein